MPHEPFCNIVVHRLKHLLEAHPDNTLVAYVMDGFTHGFNIGVEGRLGLGRVTNNKSALDRKDAVGEAIQREHSICGPFSVKPLTPFHCSPVSAVDKPDGTVRLILDMSAPRGDALNERINTEKFSCRYSLSDDAVKMVPGAGRYADMAKLDIKNAFRLCPVRKEDWWLLGFKWDKIFYVYTLGLALPQLSLTSLRVSYVGFLCKLEEYLL